jgi:hypothetical protein
MRRPPPNQLHNCLPVLRFAAAMTDAAAVAHPLPDPLIELIAQRFRVLAEPMRIKLLDQLRGGDATVRELQEALAPHSRTSPSTSASCTARAWSRAPRTATESATGSPTTASSSSANRPAEAYSATHHDAGRPPV